MGIGVRIFFVEEDDKLRRVSLRRFNDLIDGKEIKPFVEYAGRRIKYAFVIMKVEDRKPAQILKIDYYILRFNEDGFLNREHWDKQARLAVEIMSGWYDEKRENILQATHLFAQKQLRDEYNWKPPPEFDQAIVRAVFADKEVPKKPRKHRLKLVWSQNKN